MASVKYSVIVLVMLQQVFSVYSDCLNFQNIKNCNECIRCGGNWCNDPNESKRCSLHAFDNWCPTQKEQLKFLDGIDKEGTNFSPKFRLRTLTIGTDDLFKITYSSKNNPKVEVVVNSTQTSNFVVNNVTSCNDGACETSIEANPKVNFCTTTGTPTEYFNVKMSVDGIKAEAVMRYHVPCACECSENVVERSPLCNGRGNSSCGTCTCDSGWTGAFCEKELCESKRGDVPCANNLRNNLECSGNGECHCDKCKCFRDPKREGSQYYDEDNFCADICSVTSDCDDCILQPTPGRCQNCPIDMYRQRYNQSLLNAKDEINRKVWIQCNVTIGKCNYLYAAMKKNRDTFFMVIDDCSPVMESQTGAVNVTLPIVLGVLAVVAAAMATAGYMIWKNRPAPVVPTNPSYENINAEDCIGENPLYKPPMSSFNNPMYGKC